MPDDENIVSQDEIDSLLVEMQAETSGSAAKPEAGKKADPAMDPAAWGLTEDDLKENVAAASSKAKAAPASEAKKVNYQPLAPEGQSGAQPRAMEFVLDIPLMLTVEVGRTKMTIGELLTLGPGSIVELSKLAGEPLEIFVNEKLVARGEAVIVNEKFGIQLTDVISKAERIETLR